MKRSNGMLKLGIVAGFILLSFGVSYAQYTQFSERLMKQLLVFVWVEQAVLLLNISFVPPLPWKVYWERSGTGSVSPG